MLGPPRHMSFPDPPLIVSASAPPTMQSSPPPPEMTSIPGLPSMSSGPVPPLTVPDPCTSAVNTIGSHSLGLRSLIPIAWEWVPARDPDLSS
jgi:hypothetical protein